VPNVKVSPLPNIYRAWGSAVSSFIGVRGDLKSKPPRVLVYVEFVRWALQQSCTPAIHKTV